MKNLLSRFNQILIFRNMIEFHSIDLYIRYALLTNVAYKLKKILIYCDFFNFINQNSSI